MARMLDVWASRVNRGAELFQQPAWRCALAGAVDGDVEIAESLSQQAK
jgi:hypothetical protein